MDRATFLLVMAYGLLVNSAVYIAGSIAAALVLGDMVALRLALATAGVTYVSYVAHLSAEHLRVDWMARAAVALVWLSIALGIGCGLRLIMVP